MRRGAGAAGLRGPGEKLGSGELGSGGRRPPPTPPSYPPFPLVPVRLSPCRGSLLPKLSRHLAPPSTAEGPGGRGGGSPAPLGRPPRGGPSAERRGRPQQLPSPSRRCPAAGTLRQRLFPPEQPGSDRLHPSCRPGRRRAPSVRPFSRRDRPAPPAGRKVTLRARCAPAYSAVRGAARPGGLYSLLPGLAVGRDAAVALAFAVHACRELRLSRTCQPITASPGTAPSPWRRRHTHSPLAERVGGHAPRAVIDRRRPGRAAPSSSSPPPPRLLLPPPLALSLPRRKGELETVLEGF